MLLRFLVEMERKQKSDIHNREVLNVHQIIQSINHNGSGSSEEIPSYQRSEPWLSEIRKYVMNEIV